MTMADVLFLKKFGYYKLVKQLEYLAKAMSGDKK